MCVYLLNKTHLSIVFMCTHKCVCVCVCVHRRVLPLCLFPQTTHCICILVSVCYTHPAFPAPSPSLFVKTPGIMWMCVRMCVCVFAFYFAHCSVTTECFPPAYLLFHIAILWGISRASQRRVTWRKGLLSNQTPTTPEHHQPKTPFQACNQISILMRL